MTDDIQTGENTGNGSDLSQLLDTNYPLLKQFRETCPGTFKHSQALMGMVEGIASVLDLDVSFMKVAAMYHDIGKTLNPKIFTENQLQDEDPHSKLDPYVSFQMISKHVSDTAIILLNHDAFPRKLIQIACQHHGQSVMKYFYTKAGEKNKNAFRYQYEKPTCVEAAVLMICDCVEARSRSEIQAGAGQLDPTEIIEDTINGLMSDRQLDDVVIRLGDLQTIKNALSKELEGTYQKRVDYRKAKEKITDLITDK
jgi:putative nucleotidyltransferase with HDIG domain